MPDRNKRTETLAMPAQKDPTRWAHPGGRKSDDGLEKGHRVVFTDGKHQGREALVVKINGRTVNVLLDDEKDYRWVRRASLQRVQS